MNGFRPGTVLRVAGEIVSHDAFLPEAYRKPKEIDPRSFDNHWRDWARNGWGVLHALRPHVMTADFSGGCENPSYVTLTAGLSRPQVPRDVKRINGRFWHQSVTGDAWHEWCPPRIAGEASRRYIDMVVPCRTACAVCLGKRRWRYEHMMARAMLYGYARGGRAWFGTLTMASSFRPRVEAEALNEMRLKEGEAMLWHNLPPHRVDAYRARAFNAYLRLWWDRIKKAVPPEGRQSLHLFKVVEWHKDGFPHAHVVIVENDPDFRLPHELLRSEWRLVLPRKRAVRVTINGVSRVHKESVFSLGFTKFNLVEIGEGHGERAIRNSARYVAKYLGKALSFFRGPLYAGLDHDERAALLNERRSRVGRMPGIGTLFDPERAKRARSALAARAVAEANRAFGSVRSSIGGAIRRMVNAASELVDASMLNRAWVPEAPCDADQAWGLDGYLDDTAPCAPEADRSSGVDPPF